MITPEKTRVFSGVIVFLYYFHLFLLIFTGIFVVLLDYYWYFLLLCEITNQIRASSSTDCAPQAALPYSYSSRRHPYGQTNYPNHLARHLCISP